MCKLIVKTVAAKLTLARLVAIAIVTICFLFAFNSFVGVNMNLLWSYFPELDTENIWRDDVKQSDSVPTTIFSDSALANKRLTVEQKIDFPSSESESKGSSEVKNDFSSGEKQCDIKNPSEKFDCFPEVDVSEEGCEKRGCCWRKDETRGKPQIARSKNDTQAPVDVPYCFYPRNFAGYSVTEKQDTVLGFELKISGKPPNYYLKGVNHLVVDVAYESDQRLHVKV